MQMFKALILLLIFSSCSSISNKKSFKDQLTKGDPHKIKICQELVENTLKPHIKEVEDFNYETPFFFVGDEEKAKEILGSFDATKFYNPHYYNSHLLVNNCSKEHIKSYLKFDKDLKHEDFCDAPFPTLTYFQAAFNSMQKQKWTPSTKALLRSKLISYIKYESQTDTSNINKLIALSLLREASYIELLPKKHYRFIDSKLMKSEEISSRLSQQYKSLIIRKGLDPKKFIACTEEKPCRCSDWGALRNQELQAHLQMKKSLIVILETIES